MRLLKSWEALTLALVMHVENKTNDLQPRQLCLPFHDLFFFFFFFSKYEISLKVQSTLRQSNVECVLIRESSDLMHGWNSPLYFKNKCWCPIDERVISCCIPFWLVIWSVSFIASVLLYNAGPLLEATINVSSQFFHLRNLSPFGLLK